MVDSALGDDMFGSLSDADDEEELKEAPEYSRTAEFLQFAKENGISVHPKYGFSQLKTFKPYYFNGQVVRGYGVFTLFNRVKAKDIYLRVTGFEQCGENSAQAVRSFKKQMSIAQSRRNSKSLPFQTSELGASIKRENTNLASVYS